MEPVYPKRIELIRRRLSEIGADALLVTHSPNVLYLSGFSGSAGALLVEPAWVTLFTDGRYASQSREEARFARVSISRDSLFVAVGNYLHRRKKARIAFEAAWLTVAQKNVLQRAGHPGVRWKPAGSIVEELRAVKGREEIARIRQAASLGSETFEEILPFVKPGIRELEVAAEIEYRMRRKGAAGPAFETIVASGARSALPHARPSAKKLRRNELVVLDMGAILAHYCSDLTRTVYVGRAPSKIRRWYEAVRRAQAEALGCLRAGVAAGEVDAAARRVLEQSRLERHFIHSTGHGLGLEVHEEPRLARGQTQRIQAGNVVTLEPGIYLEGIGGIRLEDDVAVFSDHTELLTSARREFLEL